MPAPSNWTVCVISLSLVLMGSVGAAGLGLTGAAISSAAGALEADRPVLLHGDGLNLSPREYADVLAGPSDLLDDLFHTRRMYGGSLIRGWVYAAVALHFLDGFEERLQRGITVSEDLFNRLEKHPSFTLRSTPGGSNVFVLEVRGADPKAFRDRLATAGISMREPRDDGSIVVQVNETWSSITGKELGRRMVAALD